MPTLHALSRALEGFRASYRFCGGDEVFESLDRTIDGRIEKYLRLHRQSSADPLKRAPLRGVFSLASSPP